MNEYENSDKRCRKKNKEGDELTAKKTQMK